VARQQSLGEVLHGGPVDAEEISRVRGLLLFEGEELSKRLVRFYCLLVLSSAIATFGLLADSVATVIGAMIVAPLMLPIMGLALGVSIGDRKAIVGSLLVGVTGMLAAIVVAYLLTLPMSPLIRPEAIGQVMGRTSPKLMDLLAALATGLAGAFAIGRKDVSDTLPGVAIAISLVPPLANVGILLATGRASLALGSLLLFVTNYFAILLTGAFIFGLMRFPDAALAGRASKARRRAIAIALLMLLLLSIPLSLTSAGIVSSNIIKARVSEAASEWLEGTAYRVVSIETEQEGEVDLVIIGEGEHPSASELEASLSGRLFSRTLRLEVLPTSEYLLDTR
jgi:uncharacterized hydrophobic protein (TIGR00271 family)